MEINSKNIEIKELQYSLDQQIAINHNLYQTIENLNKQMLKKYDDQSYKNKMILNSTLSEKSYYSKSNISKDELTNTNDFSKTLNKLSGKIRGEINKENDFEDIPSIRRISKYYDKYKNTNSINDNQKIENTKKN
eukprot:Mrub_13527.p2 GENE.Mrub_13527~~Mrub_13527.p2  ORF type:complete len:156 (+),score=39.93 Mrub_13527:65-469(+)